MIGQGAEKYTEITHMTMEALIRAHLSEAEFRVMLMMLRMSVGFHRPNTGGLGINKIVNGIRNRERELIVDGTHLSPRSAKKAVIALLANNLIVVDIVYPRDERSYIVNSWQQWKNLATGARTCTSARTFTSGKQLIADDGDMPTGAETFTPLVQGRSPGGEGTFPSTGERLESGSPHIKKDKDSPIKKVKETLAFENEKKRELNVLSGDAPDTPESDVSLNEENKGNEKPGAMFDFYGTSHAGGQENEDDGPVSNFAIEDFARASSEDLAMVWNLTRKRLPKASLTYAIAQTEIHLVSLIHPKAVIRCEVEIFAGQLSEPQHLALLSQALKDVTGYEWRVNITSPVEEPKKTKYQRRHKELLEKVEPPFQEDKKR